MKMSINSTWRYATTLLLVMFSIVTFAQERTLSGKVVDENGDPLPGVAVLVKGTTKGGTTNFDGEYKITLSEGETTLVVSYIGYKTQEVSVGNQSIIDFALEVDAEQLDEVVVIGYGSVKKEDATGSVAAVNASDFNQGAITSPQEQLQGKVAGVNISTNSGEPGAGATIRIRGGSSLSASNDPLIVIDGVPVDNGEVRGQANPLSSINPNDIETFTVLKDASATAIYGSRASNGVIIITTKKGSSGQMKIDYAGNVSVATAPKTIDVMSASQFRDLVTQVYGEGSEAVSRLGTDDTDWQNEVLAPAVSTDHSVSVGGAIKDVPYRVSIGYTNQNGIVKTSNMERFSGAISVNPKFFDDHLAVSLNLKGNISNSRFADAGGALGNAVSFDPTKPVRDGNEKFGGYYTWTAPDGNPEVNATRNPVALLEQVDNRGKVNRSIGNIQLDYKFHFLPELKANLNVGYDYSYSDGHNNTPTNFAGDYAAGDGGKRSTYNQTRDNRLLDFYLQYNKEVGDFNIDAMLGYSWQYFKSSGYDYSANVSGSRIDVDKAFATERYLVSFFGRANVSYLQKYLLTVTLRYDGTSRFSPDTRWGVFPALAFAWNMKKESFLETSDAVSTLKLRLGYGVTGQQDVGSDYISQPRYTFGQDVVQYPVYDAQGNLTSYQTIAPQAYDSRIKWESTATYNIAADFGFMDDRITGTLEYYYRQSFDLLNTIPVPGQSNLNNELTTNIGDLTNQGIELSMNAKIISNSKLHWDFGFNFTYNRNEITKLTNGEQEGFLGVPTGPGPSRGTGSKVLYQRVGNPTNSFLVFEQVYDSNGKPLEGVYVDHNEDGQITNEDRISNKYVAPDFILGLNTKVSYGNWDFSMAGRANIGNYVYNDVESANGALRNLYEFSVLTNRTTSYFDTQFTGDDNNLPLSSYYVQKATFFRLDNIMLGYNFNNLADGKINLRVYTTVNNVFVITNYKGLDPEIPEGVDNNIYPRARTFLLGVNVGF